MALLLCAVIAVMSLPLTVAAASQERKVVRVGWYESTFNTTDHLGRKSGYGYEYQQKLAAYNGWEYEYVEGSWADLMEMLKKGEIDLLSDVSITEERLDQMSFSDLPMGEEEFYAFIAANNKEISSSDLSTFNGKVFGVNKGSVQADYLRQWAESKGLSIKIRELSVVEEVENRMLKDGEIDVLVTVDSNNNKHNSIPVVSIGSSEYYFAVAKGRDDLLKDLNYAMECIHSENRYYNQQLFKKYISNDGVRVFLDNAELEWIREHGTIRVGYREDYFPFSGIDSETREASGVIKDYLDYVAGCAQNASLEFTMIPYSSMEGAIQGLNDGDVDCIFPIDISVYESEKYDILLTNSIIDTEMTAVISKSRTKPFVLDGDVVAAVTRGNLSYEAFLETHFPDWKIVYYRTTEDCLKAVSLGSADCVIISSHRIASMSQLLYKYRLTQVTTGRISSQMLAVDSDAVELYSILNKLRGSVNDSAISNMIISNTDYETEASFENFIRDNLAAVIILVLILALIFIGLMVRYADVRLKEQNTRRVNEEITELNHRLQESKERLEELADEQDAKIREITDLNGQLEKARAEAEAASKAKTTFLSNMSHDIRTPMNAILGFSRMLERERDNKEAADDYIAKIQESGEYLLSIINNILDMARIDSGAVKVEPHVIDMASTGSVASDIFSGELERKMLNFSMSVNIDNHYVIADNRIIDEIAVNLFSNAVKYTPSGGSITYSLEELPCDKEGYAEYVATISDTGIGMSKEFAEHIFDSFTRERNTTESGIIGTGLGMSIVKKLVDLIGATIELETEKGKGTIFRIHFRFPIADAPAEEEHEAARENDEVCLEGRRILIAEDNDLNAEIAVYLIEELGMEAERAENGRECIDMLMKADTGYYDAVLMDIQMPVLDGISAVREIRRMDNPVLRRIPVVAMTANAFDDDRRKSIEVGMDGHLSKPIEPEKLAGMMRNVLK